MMHYEIFCIFAANMEYTLNCNGKLLELKTPQVMGILNATPDSFYAGSRMQTEQEIAERTHQILDEGATIIDVGACSTRPDSEPATEAEEMERLRMALSIVRREAPEAVISVDTYRPDVARMVVEEFGADIINDVGAPVNCELSTPQLAMFRIKRCCWTVQRWWTPCARWGRRTSSWTQVSASARRWNRTMP